ncbi:hypothetical protein M0R72_05995 [Candidatus Pacearchaeota archaeon]|jgi:hypothetical protein|nr:hypothetical protein [Candidatus Pacearchaeota archaeon]
MVRRHRVKHPGSGHGRPVSKTEVLDYHKYIYYCKSVGGKLTVFKANRKGGGARKDSGAIHHSKKRSYAYKKRDEMESGW